MDPTAHNRIQRAVDALMGCPRSDWERELERRLGDDGVLRARALELAELAADDGGAFAEASIERRRGALESSLDALASGDDGDVPWVPGRIGPYRVLGPIGRGGTGVVFRALQARPAREVAVKLLAPGHGGAATARRLELEAEILGRLQHPGIAEVFEAGLFDGGFGPQPYLAMELVDGTDVVTFARSRELDRRARVRLVIEILDAVEHAHSRGVVHRDLKPDNVLVDREGRPRLLDFGIARVAGGTLGVGAGTLEGQILGTAAYMAPEQARGGAGVAGPAADVFAVSAIAYELVTGRRPRELDGLSVTRALQELTRGEIPAARRVDPTVERDLDTILATGLEEDPRRRYPTAAALAADLRRYLDHRPLSARRAGPVDRARKWVRRNRGLAAGALATAVVLVAGSVATLLQAMRAAAAGARAERGRYAAEMLVASTACMDPVTGGRAHGVLERWAPGSPGAEAVDSLGELRWEWHLVQSLADRAALVLTGAQRPMKVAWRPDAREIAVVGHGGVSIHRRGDGRPVAAWGLPEGETLLVSVAWSPDGRHLAAGGIGGVHVWEAHPPSAAADAPPRPVAHLDLPNAVALHWLAPDELLCQGEAFMVLDLGTGAGRVVSDVPLNAMHRLCDDGAGRWLGHRLADGVLAWIDPRGVRPPQALAPAPGFVTAADHGPAAEALVLTGQDMPVVLMDAASGAVRWTSEVHREPVLDCHWHPSRPLIATGAKDGTVRLLDARTGQALDAYGGHRNPVFDVEWSPDGEVLASVSAADRVVFWREGRGRPLRRLGVPGATRDVGEAGRLTWAPGSRTLHVARRYESAAYGMGEERWLDGHRRQGLVVPDPAEGGAALVSDGHRLHLRSGGVAGQPGAALVLGRDTSTELDWVPGGRQLCAGNVAGLWLVDVPPAGAAAPAAPRLLMDTGHQLTDLRVDPTGTRVAASSTYDLVFVAPLDPGDGAPVRIRLADEEGARSVAWDPAGERIAVGTSDGRALLFDAATGAPGARLVGAARELHALAWHPSGDRLAGAGRDGTVKLWSLATGALVASFPVPDHVADLTWIEDGRALAALGFDGFVTVWDASLSLGAAGGR